MELLQASAISKSYAGTQALKNVSFTLNQGQVHALIGENGAGKSTFIKIITGAVSADQGTISVSGKLVGQATPAVMKSLGVAAIYQQPSLFAHLTVAENIALAVESRSMLGKVDWPRRRTQAKQLLDRLGARIDPDVEAGSLSMPQQQMVEIAKAIGGESKIYVMDEPTASLSDTEVDHLFRVIGELRAKGAGIMYISHRLDELGRIADQISVLRDGESIATKPMQGVGRDELVQLMVGREVSSIFPKKSVPIGEVILRLRGVGNKMSGVKSVDMEVRSGEIVGLAGLVGSGRTELANILFGLTPATEGTIEMRGKAVNIGSPQDAISAGIAYVPEDRRRHGLVQEMTVTENTTLAKLSTGLLNFPAEQRTATEFVKKLGTKTFSVDAAAATLSGGNQQKVVLSRWLATNPVVLILDEPTQGIDVGAKSEVHALMSEMAGDGMAILMISSELPEVLGMSDRIVVMSEGSIAGVLDGAAATQESVMQLAFPKRKKATS